MVLGRSGAARGSADGVGGGPDDAFYDCICPAGQDAAAAINCTESQSCQSATATGMSQCTQCASQCSTSSSVGADGG
jgi:hypothetical protein